MRSDVRLASKVGLLALLIFANDACSFPDYSLGSAGSAGVAGNAGSGNIGGTAAGMGGAAGSGEPTSSCPDPVPTSCFCKDFDNHAYLFCTAQLTHYEARAACAAIGTDWWQVSIETTGEDTWLAAVADGNSIINYWTGGRDIRDTRQWTWHSRDDDRVFFTEEKLYIDRYTHWQVPASQVGTCVRVTEQRRWIEAVCQDQYAYVCEGLGTNPIGHGPVDHRCDFDPKPRDSTCREFGGHAYLFMTEQQVWNAARLRCETLGMRLATIDNDEENTWVRDNTGSSIADYWLSGRHIPEVGDFVWADGTKLATTYSNFAAGEGTEVARCISVRPGAYWEDADCWTQRNYVCESY